MLPENRIVWIDYARVIGIWLVVLGHSFCSETMKLYIYSFHMPLFFLLSGIFWKNLTYKDFLRRKLKTLIIPYVVFNLLVYGLNIVGILHLFPPPTITWHTPLIGIVTGYGSLCCHASWFIICLFLVENIYYGLNKYLPKYKYLVVILLGLISLHTPPIKLWNISIAFVGLLFFWLGHVGRKYTLQLAEYKIYYLLIIGLMTFIINMLFVSINGQVDLVFNIYGNYYSVFILNALSGILMTFCSSIVLYRIFGDVQIVTYISSNLILILLLHPFAFALIYRLCPFGGHWSNITMAFLSILLLVPIIYIINRYQPWMLGKQVKLKIKE